MVFGAWDSGRMMNFKAKINWEGKRTFSGFISFTSLSFFLIFHDSRPT